MRVFLQSLFCITLFLSGAAFALDTILIDFGDDIDATGGDQTDWVIIAPDDINGGSAVSLGASVTLTKSGTTDFTQRDILFGSSLPDNYTFDGIAIPNASVSHDFMKSSADPVKISGLAAGDYDVTIFESYNGTVYSTIWIGDLADMPATNNMGNISQVFATISVTIDAGDDLWVQICGDPNTSFGANGLIIECTALSNENPVADAGQDQTVLDLDDDGYQNVDLDGTGSSDSDGTISSYSWEINSVEIATGSAPTVSLAVGTHTIDLTVTDNDGGSDTDSVSVTVVNPPDDVLIDFGDDINATGGDQSDWSIISPGDVNGGSAVSLGNGVTLTKTGSTDFEERYISFGTSLPDNYTFDGIVIPNQSVSHDFFKASNDPMKIEGLPVGQYDVTLFEGYNGTVDGYVWVGSLQDKPATSNTGNLAQAFATVTIDLRNTATQDIWLQICNDGTQTAFGASGAIIQYMGEPSNIVPVASAGFDQTVCDSDDDGSAFVTLDGSGSSDVEGEISSYVWMEGMTQIATGVNPLVELDVGLHTIDLTVYDSENASDTDTVVITVTEPRQGRPLPIAVERNGISLSCSGTNGEDWVVEWRFHDPAFDDHAILYVNSDVQISLDHNENNVVSPMNTYLSYDRVIGTGGVDGNDATTDDEGEIHFDFDGDGQERYYVSTDATYNEYAGAFTVGTVNYQGTSTNVWDSYSSTGGTDGYGLTGLLSDIDERWHTLNIWDDDYDFVPNSPNVKPRASDGYVWVMVMDVQAPVMQIVANPGSEFYTTPAKTYHIPELKEMTSYVSGDVYIQLYDLTGSTSESVYYRVDTDPWTEYTDPLAIDDLFSSTDTVYTFECRLGSTGTVRSRQVHYEPAQPAADETHPQNLLWADATEKSELVDRLNDGDVYEDIFDYMTNNSDIDVGTAPGPRGAWRSEIGVAQSALNNAFVSYFHPDGMYTANYELFAQRAKELLLGFGVVDPLGHERALWMPTPSPDLMCLGFEQNCYKEAAVAYDLLANYQRGATYGFGMTPIEHIKIRDNLANIAFTSLQFRDRAVNDIGEGDTHWSTALDEMVAVISMAMPKYSSPAYGKSGADSSSQTESWRPFESTKLTWFEATNPANNNLLPTGTWPQDNEYANLRLLTLYQTVAIVRDVNSDLTYNQTVWMGAHSGRRYSDGLFCKYYFSDPDTYHLDGILTYEPCMYDIVADVANIRKNYYNYSSTTMASYFDRKVCDKDQMFLSLCNDKWTIEADASALAEAWRASVPSGTFMHIMGTAYNLSFCKAFED